MAVWDAHTGYETDVAEAELPWRGPLAALAALVRGPACPVRADATGLQTADGATLPWGEIERVAIKRNLVGLPHLLVALRGGGRTRVGLPLGAPARSVGRFVEVVDCHFRPAR
jgi:hypothetical protein